MLLRALCISGILSTAGLPAGQNSSCLLRSLTFLLLRPLGYIHTVIFLLFVVCLTSNGDE